jgi:serine/threonine protein phosphatase PrpC
MTTTSEEDAREWGVRFALVSDTGTERSDNEDACGSYIESAAHVLVAVADGVSGEQGGEIASRTAVDVTLRAYKESSPSWGALKRLYRAAQQANIEIHDRALVVTELRGMSTTLTAVVIDQGLAYAAHVGDSRLYLIRGDTIVQKTKDHTVAGERRRLRLLSAERAKNHPERSILTRSLGRELIAAVDRITFPIAGGDTLLICSDGLYNVLDDDELRQIARGKDPAQGCDALIETANARRTGDNLTVAVVQVTGCPPESPTPAFRRLLSRLVGR